MATYPKDYSDPLAEESAPSCRCKDAAIGTVYKGTIKARPKLVQHRDFDNNARRPGRMAIP